MGEQPLDEARHLVERGGTDEHARVRRHADDAGQDLLRHGERGAAVEQIQQPRPVRRVPLRVLPEGVDQHVDVEQVHARSSMTPSSAMVLE
jgi:hypothetical protein